MENWSSFLLSYQQVVDELKVKFRGIRSQLLFQDNESAIEFVTGRVKSVESIKEKMVRRGVEESNIESIEDIAGIRIMCKFIEDVYDVVDILHNRTDFKIIEERDYIKNVKSSGYRSYHIIIEYPIYSLEGINIVMGEIQIRTLEMNFWSTIEHTLNYKLDGNQITEDLQKRLHKIAFKSYELDQEMSALKKEIKFLNNSQ